MQHWYLEVFQCFTAALFFQSKYKVILKDESLLYMFGHGESIEHMVSDGPLVVSSCLNSDIRVWDAITGQLVSHINRRGNNSNVDDDSKMRQQVETDTAPVCEQQWSP